MATPISDIRDQLEPVPANASVDTLHTEGLRSLAIVSAAVSLKRIADALAGGNLHLNITVPQETKNDIQQVAWDAGRSFQHGTRTDR